MEKSCWSRDPRGPPPPPPPPPPPSQPERAYFSCNCLYHRRPRLTADLAEGEGDTARRANFFSFIYFGLKLGQGFEDRAVHPHPKFWGVSPPPAHIPVQVFSIWTRDKWERGCPSQRFSTYPIKKNKSLQDWIRTPREWTVGV